MDLKYLLQECKTTNCEIKTQSVSDYLSSLPHFEYNLMPWPNTYLFKSRCLQPNQTPEDDLDKMGEPIVLIHTWIHPHILASASAESSLAGPPNNSVTQLCNQRLVEFLMMAEFQLNSSWVQNVTGKATNVTPLLLC